MDVNRCSSTGLEKSLHGRVLILVVAMVGGVALALVLPRAAYAQSGGPTIITDTFLNMEVFTVTMDADWTTVSLSNTYQNMVVVCTPNYTKTDNVPPMVVRVKNAAETSFDGQLQVPGDLCPISPCVPITSTVHCLVMEEGDFTLPDGNDTKVEAQKYNSTRTDENGSWIGERQDYVQTYTNPVVLGQVMSYNDRKWSVFWDYGPSRWDPPNASNLYTGKTVCEDTDTARADETVGFIVVEQSHGTLTGTSPITYEAWLGEDRVNTGPRSYDYQQPFTSRVGLASQAAMDGGNGGWAILSGPSPVAPDLDLAIDEDWFDNSERNHTTENVAYWVFAEPTVIQADYYVSISKASDPEIVDPGGVLTYTIAYSHTGHKEITDFYITDTLPTAVEYGGMVSLTPGWSDPPTHTTGPPATLTWYTPTLAPGASGAVVFTVTVGAAPPAVLRNNVLIGSDEFSRTYAADTIVRLDYMNMEVFTRTVGYDWTTVNLSNTYSSMVVICTPNYTKTGRNAVPPKVVRVRNAAKSSFEMRLQNPGDSYTDTLTSETVHCLVMEEGKFLLPDGNDTKIEAQKYNSTRTDENNSWGGERQEYLHTYITPTVLGQVMSYNDPDWSVFWDHGGSRGSPPSANLYTGKTVCEDTDTTRADETVGFVVVEQSHGTITGTSSITVPYEARLGPDKVSGNDYSYTYTHSFDPAPQVGMASMAGMDGGDGGWSILYGPNPLDPKITLAIDEDKILDGRGHTNENVSYLVFGKPFAKQADCHLSIFKVGDPNPITMTEQLTYTIIYTNTGLVTNTNSIVSDTYDYGNPNVSFITATLPHTHTPATKTVWWSVGDLSPGESGTLTVTVSVTNGVKLTDTAVIASDQIVEPTTSLRSFEGVVWVVNESPVVTDVIEHTDEASPTLQFTLPTSDPNGPDEDFTYRIITGTYTGTLNLDADVGEVYYDPLDWTSDYTDTFTYVVSDTRGLTDTALITIVVTADDDPLVAEDDTGSTDEETDIDVDVLANDDDPDESPLSVKAVQDPIGGDTDINITGTLVTYDPDGGFEYLAEDKTDTETFTYTVENDSGDTATATVIITITGVNDPPVAEADTYTTSEDSTVAGNVLDNDDDPDTSDTHSVSFDTSGVKGDISDNTDGAFDYDPDGQFESLTDGQLATDTFTYTVSDGHSSDTAVATVVITGVNDAPTAEDKVVNAADNDETVTVPVLDDSDAEDPDNDLKVGLVTTPTTGTATIDGANQVVYTPTGTYSYNVTFDYVISDTDGLTATAAITVRVGVKNDYPIAVDDNVTINEDTQTTIDVTGNDSDPDGSTFSIESVGSPEDGTAQKDSRKITYEPDDNFYGDDTFTYTIEDTGGLTATATVHITITAVNDRPVAEEDGYTITEDQTLTVTALGVLINDSDVESSTLKADLQDGPDHGSLTLNDDGPFIYTPTANFHGDDSFIYVATDTISNSIPATVYITVTAINDPPSFTPGPSQTVGKRAGKQIVENWATNISPGPNESGQTLTFNVINHYNDLFWEQPNVDEASGDLTFKPNANRTGIANIEATLKDSEGLTVTKFFTIGVEENTAPFAKDDVAVSDVGVPVDIYVLNNDSDPDPGASLFIDDVSEPEHGTVNIRGGGSYIRYTLERDEHTVFTYTVSDGSKTSLAQVWVYVSNLPPQAQDDETCTHRGQTRTIDVLANDTDPEGGPLDISAVSNPLDGSASIVANTVVYTPPNATFTGTVVFTYTVIDDGGPLNNFLTDTAAITVHVQQNRWPTAIGDVAHTTIDASRVIHVLENDSDPDMPCHTDYLTVFTASQPLTGSVTWDDTTVTYIPPSGYTGTVPFTATFPYTITDNALGTTGPLTASAWVTVTVVYPVGGHTAPVDTAALLWPWIVLFAALGTAVTVMVAVLRGRITEISAP